MNKTLQLGIILILLSTLFIVSMMSGLIRSDRWVISQLEVSAEYKRVSVEQVRSVVTNIDERSFFKIDLANMKEQLIQLPWVKKAQISKRWPDTLKITIHEHKAIAVWNNSALLNYQGEIFQIHPIENLRHLPVLEGPDELSEYILAEFLRLNDLLAPTGVEIASVSVSERGGWVLILRNGLEVMLGSEQIDARLLRLADTWGQLIKHKGRLPESVDMRYTNGYVARWPEESLKDKELVVEMS